MRDYPRKTPSYLLTWVIAAGLMLRSFIAPGFMLDTSDGLGIIFCEGPAGIYATAKKEGHHIHHEYGEQAGQQSHITPYCKDWSSSGLLVINTFHEPLSIPVIPVAESQYQSPFIHQFTSTLHTNRGPPLVLARTIS